MNINSYRLIPDILRFSTKEYPNKIAAEDVDRSVTYMELQSRVNRLAFYLHEVLELKHKDAVILVLHNSVYFIEAHFAVLTAGCISIPLDPDIKKSNLQYILNISGAKAMIIEGVGILNEIEEGGPMMLSIPVISRSLCSKSRQNFISYDQALSHGNDEITEPRSINCDPAVYMFTTGSTGFPKGVVLTHAIVLSALRNIIEFIQYRETDHELVTLPLSHNFGLGHMYCNLTVGGKVSLLSGITNFKLLFDTLMERQPTGMPGTPSGFKILVTRFPGKLSECGKFLKRIVINSEPTPPELVEKLISLLPNTRIMIYYGLTEASRSTFIDFMDCKDKYYYSSVGKPSPNVEIKIVGENGEELCKRQEGQVVIRGTHLMQSYLNDMEMTQKVLKDGWFFTDDLGYLDNDNYLFLTGRLSTFINKGGIKIDPREIESVTLPYPGIEDVSVIGVEDKMVGEDIVCCIVAKQEINIEDLRKYYEERLERVKIPLKFVFLDSIPRNKTGKLLKQELIETIMK